MLANMVAVGEDLLICDFAQYYHMDYRELSKEYAGILACGLPRDSRIYTYMRTQVEEREKKKAELERKNRKFTNQDEIISKSSEAFEALRAKLLGC